ncbi:MAG: efflux RND transporter periplasmic adaptor subunit [Luteolibacter sp.]|jgi:multidrug efflux pump subunit AcrA (membrane-fusion protein)|nr:efflux RND transporter periplasmic adaptor subunit [Luteolibacter sp.]
MNITIFRIPLSIIAGLSWLHAAEPSNIIVLDETSIKNLQIETVETEETDFEETFFALGRIEEIPERHGVLSSRINGRVLSLEAHEGDTVKAGQTLVRVESRQPGDPPPVIDLKAPLGGLVVESHVRLGEPVEPDKELLDISDLSEVLAIARVPEHYAAQLTTGSKAHIVVSALGKQIIEGEMLRFGTSADRVSGTIDAVFRVSNPGLRMRPGMRAEFSIILSSRKNVMSIPRAAVQGDAGNCFVYIKHFESPFTYIKSPVQIGQSNDRFVEIIKGLFPGDEVVTRGAYSLIFAGEGSNKLVSTCASGCEHDAKPESPDAHAEHAEEAATGITEVKPGGNLLSNDSLWKGISGLLAILLVVSIVVGKRNRSSNPNPAEQEEHA